MFVLCPHCQFLVTVDPVSGLPPASCPRCKGALGPSPEPSAAAAATAPASLPETAAQAAAPSKAMAEPAAPRKPARKPAAPTPAAAAKIAAKPDAPHEPAPPTPAAIAQGAAPPAEPTAMSTPPIGGPDRNAPAATASVDAHTTDRSAEQDATDRVVEVPASETPATDAVDPAPAAIGEPQVETLQHEPSAIPRRPPRPTVARSSRRWSVLVIGLLSLALAMQLLLSDRAQLAASAQWRPLLTFLCDGLGCSLPPWHEPAAFTVIERDVTPDPRRPGVLHVSASFRNDARWPQALPDLLLTLSDADGRVAGERVFRPREYLETSATKNELASGQRIAISLDVVEPAPRIVAFTFDFR